MKQLLLILRVIVAISMTATGFFVFMGSEGAFQMAISASRQARRAPSEPKDAQGESAKLVQEGIRDAMGWYHAATGTGLFTSFAVCLLAIRAGRRVKRLHANSDAQNLDEVA